MQTIATDAIPRIEIVSTIAQLADVWKLTYAAYLDRGLCDENTNGQLAHHLELDVCEVGRQTVLFPLTKTWVAYEQDSMIGTISITEDSPTGPPLPMEPTFENECDWARLYCLQRSLRLAACWRTVNRGPERVLWHLVDTVWQYAIETGIGVMLLAMHPRRAKTYQRLFGLRQIAGPLKDPTVNDAEAVLMIGDVRSIPAWEQVRKRFLGLSREVST